MIIKLGNTLWKAPGKTYQSQLDQKELDLSREKEKNRVYAYIDYHYQHVPAKEQKETLKQLHKKVWGIYGVGSKGKRDVRHEEAQKIITDTFEFVDKLDKITELKPIENVLD